MAGLPWMAIRAAMADSSPQEPCWRSIIRWSMPECAIASAATIEPRPRAYPYDTSPLSIFCLAVLILIVTERSSQYPSPAAPESGHSAPTGRRCPVDSRHGRPRLRPRTSLHPPRAPPARRLRAAGLGGRPVLGEGTPPVHLVAGVLGKLQLDGCRVHAERLRAGPHDGRRERRPLLDRSAAPNVALADHDRLDAAVWRPAAEQVLGAELAEADLYDVRARLHDLG